MENGFYFGIITKELGLKPRPSRTDLILFIVLIVLTIHGTIEQSNTVDSSSKSKYNI